MRDQDSSKNQLKTESRYLSEAQRIYAAQVKQLYQHIPIGITPAIKYLNIVIPAKAGIQEGTGCRIKSGMTELDYLIARLITTKEMEK